MTTFGERVVTHLPVTRPYSPDGALGHLVATSVPGCEEVRGGAYRRTLHLAGGPGIVTVRPRPASVEVALVLSDPDDEPAALAACRRLLDVDDDTPAPRQVAAVLMADPALRPVVERSPGQRLPRCVDTAELAVRAVLGQQISTSAARTLAARLVRAHGTPLAAGADREGGLTHLWPTPGQLACVDPATLAMPGARRRTFMALVTAVSTDRLDLRPGVGVTAARQGLARLPGVGPWTIELVALRGLGDPDAFPVTDLGVRKAAERLGLPSAPRQLTQHAERWRPYRAYAVQYLWSSLDHAVNRDWRQADPAPAPRTPLDAREGSRR